MAFDGVLKEVTGIFANQLNENLVGVYLHGSMAFGCFNEKQSDIDIIVITKKPPTTKDKLVICKGLSDIWEKGTEKGFEVSIVTLENAKVFTHPCHFELHLSGGCINWYRKDPEDFVNQMVGEDGDIARHFAVIKQCGQVLYGEPIESVFGPIKEEDYLDSILSNVINAHDGIIEQPVYYTLSLCRVLAYVQDKVILSKKGAGEWALEKITISQKGVVESALSSYTNNTPMIDDWSALQGFADYMLEQLPQLETEDEFDFS